MKAIACLLFLAALSDEGALRRRIAGNFWIPDPLPALNLETHGSFEPEPGIVADRVTYTTEFGMLVPALVYHPKDTSVKRPGLIVVNGHGGDKYAWYSFYSGILYARAGAVVLTYDAAGEGERNHLRKSGTRQHDIIQQPENAMARRMAGLMITDLELAVSYLAQRPDVDPNRISAAGYSMGSFVVALSCAIETRLRACSPAAAISMALVDTGTQTTRRCARVSHINRSRSWATGRLCSMRFRLRTPLRSCLTDGMTKWSIFPLTANHSLVICTDGPSSSTAVARTFSNTNLILPAATGRIS